MKPRLVVIVFYVSFWNCVSAAETLPQAEPLVGGQPSESHTNSIFRFKEAFIFTLFKRQQVASRSRCTGSFISANAVIAAAHCLKSNKTRMELDLTKSGNLLSFSSPATVHIHPGYNQGNSYQNDIVIFVLDKKMPSAVPLIIDSRPVLCGDSLQSYGFGRKTEDDAKSNLWDSVTALFTRPELREINMNVTKCYNNENTGKIATENSDGTSCYGDSGGPLLRRGKLVGIVSHIATTRAGLCVKGYPNYAMRISDYLDFIRKIVPDAQIE